MTLATAIVILAAAQAALSSEEGAMAVVSRPDRALVYVDGVLAGTTRDGAPLVLRLPAGRRRLRLARPDHHDLAGEVEIRRGQTLPVHAFLVPLWDFARISAGVRELAPGAPRRFGITGEGRGMFVERLRIDEPAGARLLLFVRAHACEVEGRLIGGGRVLGSWSAGREAELAFVMPEEPVEVVIVPRPVDVDVRTGLARLEVALAVEACVAIEDEGEDDGAKGTGRRKKSSPRLDYP